VEDNYSIAKDLPTQESPPKQEKKILSDCHNPFGFENMEMAYSPEEIVSEKQ
jgi:hypothetical protein